MKRILGVGLISVVNAVYMNADIPFMPDLDCTSCIRGGWNFCLEAKNFENKTANSWGCEDKNRNPNAFLNSSTAGVNSGYVCSRALLDEMNAIIN